MHICFVYNVKHKKPSLNIKEQNEQEFDSPAVINRIYRDLVKIGHKVTKLEADEKVFNRLRKLRSNIDLVFSIAEGFHGDARESQVSLFCEILNIPYAMSSPTTHAIVLDKTFTKLVLKGGGITVPDSFLVEKYNLRLPDKIDFPVIIKPNCEGSSIGVLNENVVNNKKQLLARLEAIYSTSFLGNLMVERFIEGREFTVPIIGDDIPKVLPIVEQKFDFLPKGFQKIAGYELKWFYEDKLDDLKKAYDCPAKISKKLEAEIINTTLLIYETLRIRDCARVDYRLSKEGVLYTLEVNTIPGMNFDERQISYFPVSSRFAGLQSTEVLDLIIKSALKRYKSMEPSVGLEPTT